MKRILFLLLFVCSFASGQIQKLEVIGLDTLTTTERNTITVPGDRVYFIYNETTGQFEYNVKGSGWTTFSGGGSGDVTAASAFGTDNALIRSDGTGKGVQSSGWTISDSGNMTAGGTGPGLNMNRLNSSTGVSISEVSSIGFSDGVSSSVMSISGEGTTNGDFEISEQGDASSSLNYVFSTNTWRIGTSPIATLASSGDVVGPASATDNAIARFDATTGKLLQNSGVTIDDSGNISTPGTVDGVDISALTGTDVALADAGAYFTTDNVEAALQQLGGDVLEDNDISITEDRNISLDQTATRNFDIEFGTTPSIRMTAGATAADNYLYLGDITEGLKMSKNDGAEFTTPMKVYTSDSAPTQGEGRLWYDSLNDVLKTSDGTSYTAVGGDLLPIDDATAVVKGSGDATKTVKIEADTHVPTATAVTISAPSTDLDLEEVVISDPTGVTGADQITNMMSLTQSEYDAITPAAGTYYVITDPVIEEVIQIACSDLTTAITTGTTKAYFRMPWAATLTDVKVSLLTAGTTTGITVDINESGTTVLSTKLTTDATEETSATATTAAVISDSSIADDAEITIDFDAVPTGGAGVIVTLYFERPAN